MGQSEGASFMGKRVSVFLARRVPKPAEFFKRSSEKLVSVFRSGNPCVKILDDGFQGSKGGVH